jgi:NAD(P)-dependent dehydrogenase (short-subunit alcohol dehydrogenase family)
MTDLDFGGRVAIVTGAGSGMGREHALMLASRGARIVANDISADRAAATVDEIARAGGTAVVDTHDITTDAALLVQTAIDSFDQLDIVVNNAGIVLFGMFGEQEAETWWKVFDIHVRGTVEVSRAAWPHLVKSGSGRLINIASSGMLGSPGVSAYSSAKAAIWGLGNALALEGASVGVQVSTVMPSAWTPMTEGSYTDPVVREAFRDQMPPVAIAAFVTWLAHQDTQANNLTFSVSGNAAARGTFSVLPRVRAADSTPESWVAVADDLVNPPEVLTAVHNTSELFRSEFVYLAPHLDSVLPQDTADVVK